MTDLEIVREARRLLVERGWCQGTYESGDGRHCLVGAIRLAGGLNLARGEENGGFVNRVYYAIWNAIWVETGAAVIADWNDTPGRTKDDVLALLDRVAEKLAPTLRGGGE